jgi:hypothetical protein
MQNSRILRVQYLMMQWGGLASEPSTESGLTATPQIRQDSGMRPKAFEQRFDGLVTHSRKSKKTRAESDYIGASPSLLWSCIMLLKRFVCASLIAGSLALSSNASAQGQVAGAAGAAGASAAAAGAVTTGILTTLGVFAATVAVASATSSSSGTTGTR